MTDRRILLGETEITFADLEVKLKSNARIQKDKELYLHADRSLPYGTVVEIMAVEPGHGFREAISLLGPFASGAPAIFTSAAESARR